MTEQRPTIGIVGFSEFNKLLIRHLSPFANIVVASRQPNPDAEDLDCKFVSNEEVMAQDIVIPSIPAQHLEEFFKQYAHCLRPGSLVVDVCSVKVKSVEVLKRLVPENVSLLATHPMFGPASAANGLEGQRIMIHPVRITSESYEQIKTFLKTQLKLTIVECTPEEHDEMMAYVQGLSHYIGRVMQQMNIPETELMTNAYADLLDMKRIQGNDSWELFLSIMHENPYVPEVHQRFLAASRELDQKLGLQNPSLLQ